MQIESGLLSFFGDRLVESFQAAAGCIDPKKPVIREIFLSKSAKVF
jgi:hypothetical protein